jgi:hypothetical protein
MTVLLTRKSVVQAAIENTYNVAASVGVSDGVLVNNPTFTIRPNVLERNFVRGDLSPMPILIGRKIATMEFETELRGNGVEQSGKTADAPIISRLFRACGYALKGFRAAMALGPYNVGDETDPVAWAISSGATAAQTFTSVANFVDGDILHIDGIAYRMKTAIAQVNDVLIGANAAASLSNIAAAVNGGAGVGLKYFSGTAPGADVAATTTSTTLVITAAQQGTYGNAIVVSYTAIGSSAGSWGAGTLAGGANVATNTDVICYYLTCTTGGPSGTAQIGVNSDVIGEALAPAAVTTATPFAVGTKGLTITPTFTGSLVIGQKWVVWIMPSGLLLQPISDNFESITLAMHKDGLLHQMPGSFGTFEVTAEAGNFATVKWTFTGTYDAAVDDPNPSPTFETTLPEQVQLARLWVNQFNAIVQRFTFNQANDIQIRPDVSSSDGYKGTRIVSRKPEGGIDPEADLVANNDFWGQFASATRMPFQMRVGIDPGNTIWVFAPNTQYSGMTYQDRNGIMAFDAGLRFARSTGNDEILFYLM